MNLHIEKIGSGKPLVLLHGWGMHSGMWQSMALQLANHYEVHCVDLPGHGHSAPITEFSLDAVVDTLSAAFVQPVSVCGWSLGGQIAMHWAAQGSSQLERLVLVTSTPCFMQREDWQLAMPMATLAQFAAELEKDHQATLRRFLALQVRGSDDERELLLALRAQLSSRAAPDLAALRGGLEILRDADLRGEITQIHQPTLLIAGERDKLTPPQASQYLAHAMSNARVVEIKGAAHAPFLSHPQVFLEQLKNFIS